MSEPWIFDHIHEKPKDPHRVGRYVVGVALVYVFALMTVVYTVGSVKDKAKSVKQRLTQYNKGRRNSNE